MDRSNRAHTAASLLLFLCLRAAADASAFATARAKEYRAAALGAFRDDLLALAAIPSISSLPEHAEDVEAAAEW